MKLISFTAFLFGLSPVTTTLAAKSFSASNLYYAAGLTDSQSTTLLEGLQDAGVKSLARQSGTVKGTPINNFNSLQGDSPDAWDDTVLNRLDSFMWYGTGDFYTNAVAIGNFKNRIAHVLAHVNPTNGNTWGQSSEYIFAFEAQNEAMHPQGNPSALTSWQCTMAQAIKDNMYHSPDILVITGGGAYLDNSLLDVYFTCAFLDVLAIHAYGTTDFETAKLQTYVDRAKSADKKLIMQEWGACYTDAANHACNGGSPLDSGLREASIKNWAASIDAAGIPWIYWQILPNADPHDGWDYEIGVDDVNWAALRDAGLAAGQVDAAFDFDAFLL
ncbi:glycoside hydrolase superfamily [Aspergillus spectabilis]